jgi:hypothetical protein
MRWRADVMVSKKNRILPTVLGALFLLFFYGCNTAHGDRPGDRQGKIQIQGKVSVKGSGPHTYLCLSASSGADYRLEGGLKDLIWGRYQQETITLEGVIAKKAMGPGFPAEFVVHKILSNEP